MNVPAKAKTLLADRLRVLRGDRRQEDVVVTLNEQGGDWSVTKLSRIENTQRRVLPAEIDELLDLYSHDDLDERAKLKMWAKATRRRKAPSASQDLPAGVQDFVDNEEQATRQLIWEPLLVPALCQDEDFAAALIAAMEPTLDGHEIDRRVKARLARQRVLTRAESPQELHVIVAEEVLVRTVGSATVTAGLLRHLLDFAASPNVTVQMIASSVGAHPGLAGWFSVLEFDDPDFPALGFTDGPGGQVHVEDPDKVRSAILRFGYLSGIALSVKDTAAWIRNRIVVLDRG